MLLQRAHLRRQLPGLPGVVGIAERDELDLGPERLQPGRPGDRGTARLAAAHEDDAADVVRMHRDRLRRAVVDEDHLLRLGLLLEHGVQRLGQEGCETVDRHEYADHSGGSVMAPGLLAGRRVRRRVEDVRRGGSIDTQSSASGEAAGAPNPASSAGDLAVPRLAAVQLRDDPGASASGRTIRLPTARRTACAPAITGQLSIDLEGTPTAADVRRARRPLSERKRLLAAHPYFRLYKLAKRRFDVSRYLVAAVHYQETGFGKAPASFAKTREWQRHRDAVRTVARPARYPNRSTRHPSVRDDFDVVAAIGAGLHADGARGLGESAQRALAARYGTDPQGRLAAAMVIERARAWRLLGTLPLPGRGELATPVRGVVGGCGYFGCPRPGHLHNGVDFVAPANAPIHAAAEGRVALVESSGASGGYGNFICIQHRPHLATCYAHLSAFAAELGVGTAVSGAGRSSASSGRRGRAPRRTCISRSGAARRTVPDVRGRPPADALGRGPVRGAARPRRPGGRRDAGLDAVPRRSPRRSRCGRASSSHAARRSAAAARPTPAREPRSASAPARTARGRAAARA